MSDEQIQQFIALTNASTNVAADYLNEFGDLGEALNAFYATQQDEQDTNRERSFDRTAHTDTPSSSEKPDISYARTLSGQKIPIPRSTPTPTSTHSQSDKSKSKFKSFSEMMRGSEDDDEDPENRNTFAGGETSGLEITDPHANDPNYNSNSLIKDLLEKARRGGQRADEEDSASGEEHQNHFSGKGYRLGSDVSAPPTVVEDNTPAKSKPTKVTREITFWKEGFQIGNGKLYRYDDPENSYYLKELNQGRAPLKLLDVEFGQEVDVTVYKKLEDSYVPPKSKVSGFQGSGQRLGSPIPGDQLNSGSPEVLTEEQPKDDLKGEAEEIKGDTSVQIRYATGKREVLRCNSTDTVRSLYEHVKSNTTDIRPFTLSHAFPVKAIDAFDSTLKEQSLCNAVVVQRWV